MKETSYGVYEETPTLWQCECFKVLCKMLRMGENPKHSMVSLITKKRKINKAKQRKPKNIREKLVDGG